MPLIASLGIAQIISRGSLYYSIGVLGPAMRGDPGINGFGTAALVFVAVLIAVALGAAASYGIAVRPVARRRTA